ncbi:VOC family protein [Nitrosomonas sp. sh817]|uniref:VOC family protein n=1 Tax=Nitrosomonas sp. sh817 TaxID=3070658 RepID=UPI0027DC33F2|nr:VOC family protein [Nitrosomonas sp. sh817]WMJ07326.1 VOC family protein [Nitrosomonas sp. sh817]
MKANAIGINHVALEVGDIEEAIKFYSDFLNFEVQEKNEMQASIYFGDQFINFIKNDNRQADQKRHVGIAVDNKELVRQTLEHMRVKFLSGSFLDFLDPWGNRIEITTYSKIQYTKADHVLRGMGLGHLKKTEEALAELNAKGLGPTQRDNS